MTATQSVTWRLPVELLEEVDDYAARLAKKTPGLRVTRTAAARVLLRRGLNTDDGDELAPGIPPPPAKERDR